jgi:hypothetical protein
MKSILVILNLLVFLACTAVERIERPRALFDAPDLKVVLTAIPKSGIHLAGRGAALVANVKFHRLWGMINHETAVDPDLFEKAVKQIPSQTMSMIHLTYNPAYEKILRKNNCKVLCIIRDPRTRLISRTRWILEGKNHKMNHLKDMTFDQLLLHLIKLKPGSTGNIRDRYKSFMGWMKSPCCYTTRFEDLVGPQGGGSVEAQRREIKNIARHLGFTLTEEQCTYVAKHIFGNTATFRTGQCGWEELFKPIHRQAFKEAAGDILIKFGYAKDNNW